MNKLISFGLGIAVFVSGSNAMAQSSNWVDMLSGALPRSTFPTPSTSTPSATSTSGWGATSYPGGYLNTRRDWKLGVGIQNNDVGAIVTTVAPGSAAQQVGLNVNDVVIAAGPSRLGVVDGRVIELAEEIKRYADSYGRINLLIMDSRTRSLRSVTANLTSNSSALSGSVAIRDNMNLPAGSYLNVQLKNISRPFYEVGGGSSTVAVQGFGPFAYELNVDPRYVSPGDQYQLIATISYGSQILYQLNSPPTLNSNSLGQNYNLVLDRSGGISTAGSSVSAAYPPSFGGSSEAISKIFLQYLGRAPSSAELIGWQGYLSQGNSLDGLKVGILSSIKYREMFRGDDAAYVQSLVTALVNRTPNQQELSFWLGRLQATGSAETVAREILDQRR